MSELDHGGPIARLESATADLSTVRTEIDEIGHDRVERTADAFDRFDALLSRYRERASGSGRETFEAYVEFEGKLENFVDRLPSDLLHREAFEAAEDVLDRRRLAERDFDEARSALQSAREVAELVAERREAERRYREARHAVQARRREVDAELEGLAAVLDYEDVDLDASVDALRDPFDRYEAAVEEAFRSFKAEASARDVLGFVEATEHYPLVEFEPAPAELVDYLSGHPAGEEPIPTLLEWAEFTRSKLSHYVDDPGPFLARVGGNRTYLDRLDAGPLHVGWPPPPAETLRFRARELVAVVERFAPESTVEDLHAVREVARRADYSRLRRTALARTDLSDAERRSLRSGAIHDELAALREERDRLSDALAEHGSL